MYIFLYNKIVFIYKKVQKIIDNLIYHAYILVKSIILYIY